jgi:hypothetical protein
VLEVVVLEELVLLVVLVLEVLEVLVVLEVVVLEELVLLVVLVLEVLEVLVVLEVVVLEELVLLVVLVLEVLEVLVMLVLEVRLVDVLVDVLLVLVEVLVLEVRLVDVLVDVLLVLVDVLVDVRVLVEVLVDVLVLVLVLLVVVLVKVTSSLVLVKVAPADAEPVGAVMSVTPIGPDCTCQMPGTLPIVPPTALCSTKLLMLLSNTVRTASASHVAPMLAGMAIVASTLTDPGERTTVVSSGSMHNPAACAMISSKRITTLCQSVAFDRSTSKLKPLTTILNETRLLVLL